MIKKMLRKALENYQLFEDVLNRYPQQLIKAEITLLPQEYQQKWRELETTYHNRKKPTYDRNDPLYNLEYLETGDQVISLIKGEEKLGVGTVEIKTVKPSGMAEFTIAIVHFSNGYSNAYYPNQLGRAFHFS